VASVDRHTKGVNEMKWQGYSPNAGNRINKLFAKLAKNKGIYYLLMIASLGLALGANVKWHP